MGAKISAEMKKAQKLVMKEGYSVSAAAKLVGISATAVYIKPWYKEWKKERDAELGVARPDITKSIA